MSIFGQQPMPRPDGRDINEWIDDKAIELVGRAALYAQYRKWKELEGDLRAALRQAYERRR